MLIALLRLADRTGATRHERATQPALLIEVPSPGRWSRRSRGMAGTPACDSAKQIGSSHPSDGMMWRPQRRPRTEARHRRRDEVIRGLTPSGPLRKPCEIVRGVARPRGWPSWFRLCGAGFYSPGKPRGRSAEVALGNSARSRGIPPRRARPFGEGNAAPFGAPHGVGRPARARSRLTARFQHFRWSWPSPGSDRGHERSLCRWADPRAARAPCLQGTKAQAPYPAPPPDASGDALE
jgi:hypothetical protein